MSRRALWAVALATVAIVGLQVHAAPERDPAAALAEVLPAAIARGRRCLVRVEGPTGRVRSGVAVTTSLVLTGLDTFRELGEGELHALTPAGRRVELRPLGRDLRLRVVALEAQAELPGVEPLPRAAPAQPGRLCLVLGAGLGEPTATFGMVSATDRFQGRVYQVDAPVDRSNFGGPLLDVEGDLLGLVIHVDDRLGRRSGVGFAIPFARIDAALPRLMAGEVLEPGWLGGRVPRLGDGEGVALRSVDPDGPLGQAGLQAGDRIQRLDGRPTPTSAAFRAALLDLVAGQRIEVVFSRDGVERRVTINCGRR
ncbi:MAG: S1C family serine protease [Planctomycetota bacterium]